MIQVQPLDHRERPEIGNQLHLDLTSFFQQLYARHQEPHLLRLKQHQLSGLLHPHDLFFRTYPQGRILLLL